MNLYETEMMIIIPGRLRDFPFRNGPGLHTILFKAWDVYNKFSNGRNSI